MRRHSFLALARNALSHHQRWPRAWRSPEPRERYEVVIVGGGGHGLATAYYLAKEHGITDVAVLERGWIGSGNTGRNTTIIRSDYVLEPNGPFYQYSLRLWEGLTAELNLNLMFSQRGALITAHDDAQVDAFHRRGNVMRLRGDDAQWLSPQELKRLVPILDCSPTARFPIRGALLQRRAGVARHDAIAWGYAQAADARGVDVIQNCEVTGILRQGGRVTGVETTRGRIAAGRIGIAVAGHTSRLGAMAGLRLPIESHLLQAMVSEPIKPVLDTVVRFTAAHFYVSQTDKGELVMGGSLDGYNSYARRGHFPALEHVVAAAVECLPIVSRLRLLRSWAGIMDMTMDGSPIIGTTPVEGLFLNGGWCYGGFKATPASGFCFAHTIATGHPHRLIEGYGLERFAGGRPIDEAGRGPVPGAH